jgi:hypothetical protein
MKPKIFVENADVIHFACDVLVLKYAQTFYGVDAIVANLLGSSSLGNVSPSTSRYALLSTEKKLAAKNVLSIGVPPLYQFDYRQIREFASYSLQVSAEHVPYARHIAMTLPSVDYGLDEKETFMAQIAGLLDAINTDTSSRFLERITIIEVDKDRTTRLKNFLEEYLPNIGLPSDIKPHIFVAMPFNEEMEDVYTFGIQKPVNDLGFLCERVDMVVFTGDILTRIKSRIESASLIVADLTGANPNVYLEVGYAWGKNRPTLLLAKETEELKFDVRGQQCIIYKNISDLAKKLEVALATLSVLE